MPRYIEVDAFRGIAIIAMVGFHILFDLNYFTGYSFNLHSGLFLALGRFSAVAFLFLVGLSLTLSYSRAKAQMQGNQLFRKYLLRGAKIFSLGLLITAVTFLLFPQGFIVFGILHCIGISIILAFPFLSRKRAALAAAIPIILIGLWLQTLYFDFPWLLWLGIMPRGFYSFDYAPLLPWFGVVLLGIFFGHRLYPQGKRSFSLSEARNPLARFLAFLGRHSLAIYFLHQPLLVAAILLLA